MKINELSSIYTLKSNIMENKGIPFNRIGDISLYYENKILDDKKLVKNYGINDINKIELRYKLKGGRTSSVNRINYLYVFMMYFIYALILLSGFIIIFSKIYGHSLSFILKYIIKIIYWFFGKPFIEIRNGKRTFISMFINFVALVIKFISIYLFVYISSFYTSMLSFYLTGSKDWCNSISYGEYVGYNTTAAFLIIYIILNIPNYSLFFTDRVVRFFPNIVSAPLRPQIALARTFFDSVKLYPYYWIPIFGQLLKIYHNGIEQYMYGLELFLYGSTRVDCKDMRLLGKIISKLPAIPGISRILKNYNLYGLLYLLKPGLLYYGEDKVLKEYIKDPKHGISSKLPFINNLTYYGIKFFTNIFCSILKISKAFQGFIDESGGPAILNNYIKTGSIAGLIAFLFNIGFMIYASF